MNLSRTVHIALAAFLCAAAAVPAALAGGEPKNNSPFTRLSAGTAAVQLASVRFSAVTFLSEPKNAAPFTRPVHEHPGLVLAVRHSSQLAASIPAPEPKNNWPFIRILRVQR